MTASRPLRVLDLFAGLGGFSNKFRDAGHQVIALDIEARFGCELTMDICEFAKDPWDYLSEASLKHYDVEWDDVDLILASPDCRGFSIARIGSNWYKNEDGRLRPKHPTAELGIKLLEACLMSIDRIDPRWFLIENPRGVMRLWLEEYRGWKPLRYHHPEWCNEKAPSVTYCKYGGIDLPNGTMLVTMKPTDLWGVVPRELELTPPCGGHPASTGWGIDPVTRKPMTRDRDGNLCHEKAPRGTKMSGIQGIRDPAKRAIVPSRLSQQVLEAVEAAHAKHPSTYALAKSVPQEDRKALFDSLTHRSWDE